MCAPEWNLGNLVFCPVCLCDCLSVCGTKTLTLTINYRNLIFDMHSLLTKTISNGTRANDLDQDLCS